MKTKSLEDKKIYQSILGRKKTILSLLLILTFSTWVAFAAAQSGTTSAATFTNPITPTSIEGVFTNIWTYLQSIAGTIAVIFIIIGGIMYMVSGGDKDATERAKKTIIFAIIGLAIILAAPLLWGEINNIINGGSSSSQLKDILLRVLQLLLSIVGFIAIISMVVGGIWMLTAVGDEEKYELGKKTATYAIIGLIIVLAALMIATQVVNLIGSTGATPSTSTPGLPGTIGT